MRSVKIPRVVVYRLSLYLRALNILSADGVKTVSSKRFGRLVDVKPAQLRKDLAYFGQFGIKGVGYEVRGLMKKIIRILGTDRSHKVALVGVGNLGRALLAYKSFEKRGFRIVAAFDSARFGKKTSKGNLMISDPRDLPRVIREEKIKIGIIAVPAASAQPLADVMAGAGVRAILNFAPVRLHLPGNVNVENIDLSIGLETLSFSLKAKGNSR